MSDEAMHISLVIKFHYLVLMYIQTNSEYRYMVQCISDSLYVRLGKSCNNWAGVIKGSAFICYMPSSVSYYLSYSFRKRWLMCFSLYFLIIYYINLCYWSRSLSQEKVKRIIAISDEALIFLGSLCWWANDSSHQKRCYISRFHLIWLVLISISISPCALIFSGPMAYIFKF